MMRQNNYNKPNNNNNHGYIHIYIYLKHIICQQNKNPLLKLKMQQVCASYLSHPYLPSYLAHQSIERPNKEKETKIFYTIYRCDKHHNISQIKGLARLMLVLNPSLQYSRNGRRGGPPTRRYVRHQRTRVLRLKNGGRAGPFASICRTTVPHIIIPLLTSTKFHRLENVIVIVQLKRGAAINQD